ncbi:hypothetical protein AURDEDRAFT_177320 [Auricularia subglabra TFB-10046 SS5]|uniref:REJ domain-containing protein n=1 Tax=Auricularia subglabra (strain TFB-10046 / SS5) TaxID=717982 RepID=J0D4E2_AURST|nr:hypothetical protein AURDEDRAFT_177320 [Auricularia subglabra TFB-10046 SS5]
MPLYPPLVRTFLLCIFPAALIRTHADDPAATTLAATFTSPPMLSMVSGALDPADSPTPTSLGAISISSPSASTPFAASSTAFPDTSLAPLREPLADAPPHTSLGAHT